MNRATAFLFLVDCFTWLAHLRIPVEQNRFFSLLFFVFSLDTAVAVIRLPSARLTRLVWQFDGE